MNEQITKLMIETGKTIPGDKHIDADFCDKFARLIVQECAGIYDKIDNGNDHLGTDNYLKALQRHFGIARERSNSKTC